MVTLPYWKHLPAMFSEIIAHFYNLNMYISNKSAIPSEH